MNGPENRMKTSEFFAFLVIGTHNREDEPRAFRFPRQVS